MSGKTKPIDRPKPGGLWYGCQGSFDDVQLANQTFANMEPEKLMEMRVRGVELLSTLASAKDHFADHYMVDTYGDGKLAVVSIQGSLMNHPLPLRAFGFNVTTYKEIQSAVQEVLADSTVEQVLLSVGSGGGSGNGLFRTSNFLEKASQIKPIHTFTDTTMGSAAYWLGVNGQKLYAEPMAEIGSIGVYVMLQSYAKMNEQFGLDVRIVRAGEFKALGHPEEAISEKALAEIQRNVDYSYDQFLEHTSSKRGRNKEQFRVTAAEGRVFFGPEAQKVGLVDEIMVFDDVIEAMLGSNSRSVPVSGQAGRRYQTNEGEGTMNEKMRKLLEKAGIKLSAEQLSAIASGASLQSLNLNISAELQTQLDAAAAEGGDEGGEGGGGEETEEEKTARLAEEQRQKELQESERQKNLSTSGKDQSFGEMLDRLQKLQADLTQAQTELATLKTANTQLKAEKDKLQADFSSLVPIVGERINALNVALRRGQVDVQNLDATKLVELHTETKTAFESVFPSQQVSKTPAEKPQQARPAMPAELSAAAKEATTI